jgi:hypothetical protein
MLDHRTKPATIEALFAQLMAAEKFKFPRSPTQVKASYGQGVYVIYDQHGAVAHVGMTKLGEGGLFRRMRDHVCGYSSFHRLHLEPKGQKVSNGFSYAWLVVDSPRTRALLEGLATGRLCPAHIGANVDEAKQRADEERQRKSDEMMRSVFAELDAESEPERAAQGLL